MIRSARQPGDAWRVRSRVSHRLAPWAKSARRAAKLTRPQPRGQLGHLARALLTVVAAASSLVAQAPVLSATPPGGTVRVLAADSAHPQTVLLGTATGAVFRSTDAGMRWKFFSHIGNHEDWVISSLTADPARPGHWYASLWSWTDRNGGVFASADEGRNWQPLWLGHAVRALALAPSDPRILIAAALDGVYRSLNGGQTWNRISPPHDPELENVESVAISPHNPQEIYVGTWHLPWKTVNGGHDWWQMRQGVIDDSDVFSITVDRQNPATLYLSACSGIYRSQDRGNHFLKIQGIPYSARRTPAIVQDPYAPATIYAGTTQGLWVSHNRGANWRRITSPQLSINAVLPLPHRLLLGTNFAGVIASEDGGASFQPSNQGFSSRHVAAVAIGPAGRYLAVTGDQTWGGVFLQTSDAAWHQLPPLPDRAEALGLCWSSQGLLAATRAGLYLLPASGGPRRRAKGWQQPHHRWPRGALYAIASLAPGSPQVWASGQLGLYYSGDGGLQWSLLRNAPAPLYRVLAAPQPAAGSTWLWIAGDGYVLRSDDGGRHFLSGRLSLDGAQSARINQLALAPLAGSPSLLLAATTAGLYQSHDEGAHWIRSGHGLPALNIRSVQIRPDGIYAFAATVGLTFCSRDGGDHWQAVHLSPAVESEARLAPTLPQTQPEGPSRRHQSAGGSNPEP
ncbi:MAG: WD40/YVTN/BNR-like repeat-containing protein [Terriglobales bacterium]